MTAPIQNKYLRGMTDLARFIDKALNGRPKPSRQPKVGFVLLVAEFGRVEDGRVNYISNGDRESMIAMLREYLARVEGRVPETPEKRTMQ